MGQLPQRNPVHCVRILIFFIHLVRWDGVELRHQADPVLAPD